MRAKQSTPGPLLHSGLLCVPVSLGKWALGLCALDGPGLGMVGFVSDEPETYSLLQPLTSS